MQTWLEWKHPNVYNRYQAHAALHGTGCREWLRANEPLVLMEYDGLLEGAKVG